MRRTTGSTSALIASAALVVLCCAYWFVLDVPSRGRAPVSNPARAEAEALRSGSLELPERMHDTAERDGRAYNVFQPGMTLLYLVHDDESAVFIPYELFALFVLTALLLHRALLRLSEGRRATAFALTVSVMFGAPYIASLRPALDGAPWRINHVVSVFFMAGALNAAARGVHTRALAWTGFFIGGAMLFRVQSALMLALPLALLMQDGRGEGWLSPAVRPGRRVAALLAYPVLAVLVVAGFQYARFGSPFETGYGLIYAGRSDVLALRAAEHGLMSLYFLPENLWRTFLALPWPRFEDGAFAGLALDDRGNSLLFSQPALLLGVAAWGARRSARMQAFAFVGLLMSLPVLLHHNPGWYAPGYMRLALDYLPMWIAATAVALAAVRSRRTSWAATACALFAVAYGLYLL